VKRLEQVEFQFREISRFNLALAIALLKSNDLKKAEDNLKRCWPGSRIPSMPTP